MVSNILNIYSSGQYTVKLMVSFTKLVQQIISKDTNKHKLGWWEGERVSKF